MKNATVEQQNVSLQNQQQQESEETTMMTTNKNKSVPAAASPTSSPSHHAAMHKKMRTKSIDVAAERGSSTDELTSADDDDDDESSSCTSPTNIIRLEDYFSPSKPQQQQDDDHQPQTTTSPPLPDPDQDVDPDVFLAKLVESICGFTPKTKPALSLDCFPEISEERIAAYDMQLVVACRENNVDTLKELYQQQNAKLDCCNRFGESLLHMSCRRGFQEMVTFLLTEAQLNVHIRDDCGRNPFHDACWNPTPQLEICELLLERDPSLLLITDSRGFTPFQYARPQDWPTWRQWLLDHRSHLSKLSDSKGTFCLHSCNATYI
jgi:ankyrin repeat protein